jgi:hypothetical protein
MDCHLTVADADVVESRNFRVRGHRSTITGGAQSPNPSSFLIGQSHQFQFSTSLESFSIFSWSATICFCCS